MSRFAKSSFQTKVFGQVHWLTALLYSCVAGFFAFYSFVGLRPLLPSNIAWLTSGDPPTFYLGWLFFRNSDWTLPLGLNPQYGLELSNSLLYSDSNPLLAFIFKPFTAILPQTFQYFGLWLLICFVLQAWFAFKLMGLISKNTFINILGASLFLCAPPMIARLLGHYSLTGHFFILAALYLTLRPSTTRRIVWWAVLVGVTALVHAYLLAIVGIIWLADCLGRCLNKTWLLKYALLEAGVILGVTICASWQAGYFMVGSGVMTGGFGEFRMNLLSIFDPQAFSYIVPEIPKTGKAFEGLNYLGIGVIFLGVCSIFYALAGSFTSVGALIFRAMQRWPVLLLAALCLTIYAVTNRVGIASYDYIFDIPESVINIANVFRASGRMFWPVHYLIVLACIYLVIKVFPTRAAIVLLGFALVIQYVDTSRVWLDIRANYAMTPSAVWPTTMTNPFWEEAALKYKHVKVLIPRNSPQDWRMIADYAGRHGMGTDAVYLARLNTQALLDAEASAKAIMLSGKYDPSTLYIIEDASPLVLNIQNDLLARVDGFTILAPGWKNCERCSQLNLEITALGPVVERNQRLQFGGNFLRRTYLHEGWYASEPLWVWSDGSDGTIILPLRDRQISQVLIEASPLLAPSLTVQNIGVKMNGVDAESVQLSASSGNQFTLPVPEKVLAQLSGPNPVLKIQLHFFNAARPSDLGINQDTRILAIALKAITLIGK